MSITFKLRDGEVKIPENELESCIMVDWYIGKLINNLIDTDQKNEFEIWEDKDVFMTIIDSVRFNKFILKNESINLQYLYCLSEKWCVPENIIDDIKNKIKQSNILESYINSNIQKCSVCYKGFNIHENHSESCVTHTGSYIYNTNTYSCCGNDNTHKGCKCGYHVHNIDISILHELKAVYKLVNK